MLIDWLTNIEFTQVYLIMAGATGLILHYSMFFLSRDLPFCQLQLLTLMLALWLYQTFHSFLHYYKGEAYTSWLQVAVLLAEELSWKNWTPLFLFPPFQKYQNIWTPQTKMFEIIGLPLKYFIPPTNLPKHYFHACIKGVQIFHLK